LFFDPPARDWIGVAMGAFDTPTSTHLAMHIFVAEKGDYYEIADGLPQNQHWAAYPRARPYFMQRSGCAVCFSPLILWFRTREEAWHLVHLRGKCGNCRNEWTAAMRTTLIVVGVLLMFFGAVWFFQGINVLPGSFMTGQRQWAIYGGIAFVVGVFAI
jgi:hypothetical protein